MKCKLQELSFLLLIASTTATAQADSTKQTASFSIGTFHSTRLNYYGRTDSLQSSGVFLLAELRWGKGFYINAAPVFINNNVAHFDYAGTVATAGYRFEGDQKISGNIFFVKPFYEKGSQLVQSALKGQLSSALTFQNKFLNLTAGADVKLSDNIDFGTTCSIDHVFRFEPGKKIILVLNPTAGVHAGTQRFSRTYYKKSTGFLLFQGVEQQITEEADQFNILSYELLVPVLMAAGKFQFITSPAFVIPQNLIQIDGRPDLSERGNNLFYLTVGIKLTL